MKTSKFNIIFRHNGKNYITNTLSKSITELEDDYRKIIDDNELSRLSDEDQAYLLKNGFAVSDETDEIGLLRYRANKIKNSKEEMEFVIAPTLSCNFKCTYCFESPRNGCMNKETQQNVLSFIFNKTSSSKTIRVHIIWFGGEPLLYPDIVINMNQRIFNYCQQNGKEFKSDIITNGYLLNAELLNRLKAAHINHFQITMDGIKEIHDSRRMLRDGRGTYDVIYNNLKLFKNSDLKVSLRVNIDKNNISTFNLFEKEITDLNNHNIECSPALVEVSSKHLNDIVTDCFVEDNSLSYYYNNSYIKKYYNTRNISDYSLRLFFCEAEHHHSYAIDELGNVYKCWNSLGVDKDILCTVTDENYNSSILSTFFARDPFTEDDCKECPYIPICAGGCYMQKKLHNKNFCAECKYTFLQSAIREIDNM